MPWQICFPARSGELAEFGGQICIPLFVQIRELPPVGPEPDPRNRFDFQELVTLASIDSMAEQLAGDVGAEIRRSVETRMMAMNRSLGDNAGISRMEFRPSSAAE